MKKEMYSSEVTLLRDTFRRLLRRNAKTGTETYGRVRQCFLQPKWIIVVSPRPNNQNEGAGRVRDSTEEYGKVRKPIVLLRRNVKTGTAEYGIVQAWLPKRGPGKH